MSGVASAVPLMVDETKVALDFHIFDVLNLNLLLGYPLEKLFDPSLGSLDEKLREAASATTISCSGHPMAEPLPKQDPLEKMMHISPFALSKLLLIKGVGFPTPHECDSDDTLHLCGGERSSSRST